MNLRAYTLRTITFFVLLIARQKVDESTHWLFHHINHYNNNINHYNSNINHHNNTMLSRIRILSRALSPIPKAHCDPSILQSRFFPKSILPSIRPSIKTISKTIVGIATAIHLPILLVISVVAMAFFMSYAISAIAYLIIFLICAPYS